MAIEKENYKYHFILYLISPVLGLIYGLKSGSKTYIRWTIYIFTVIFGSLLTFGVMGGERGKKTGADGAIQLNHVYDDYQYKDFSWFWEQMLEIFTLSGKAEFAEPYGHILAFIFGSFLNSPGSFFVGVALVYGYFFSGSLVKLLSYVDWNSNYNRFYFFSFLAMMVMWVNLKDMNTVRTWTGMWVLIYAVMSYYETKHKKYLLLAFVPPFIHIGFSAMCIPVWIVLFSGYRNPKLYFIIFILSTLFSGVTQQSGVYEDVASTSELASRKVSAYSMDEDKIEKIETNRNERSSNFYKMYEKYGMQNYVLTGLVIFIFLFLRQIGFSKIENTLFSYGLALASFANFTSFISALHARTWTIAAVFIMTLVVVFLSKNNFRNTHFAFMKVKLPLTIFTLLFIPYFLLKISMFLNIGSVFLFFTPFFSWINPEIGISIRDFIVSII